jgi:hypothetical protein
MSQSKRSIFYRSAEFAFSLRSWKRSFTVPFKRMGGYSKNVKESAKTLYKRYDNLKPAINEEEVALAVKKSKSSAVVNLCFAIAMGVLSLSRVQVADILQTAACVVIMMVFSMRFIIDAYIVITGNEQIRQQNFPTLDPDSEESLNE